MPKENDQPIGLTKEAGWQIGVRRTLSVPCPEVWHLLTSARGLRIWLGPVPCLDEARGAMYELDDGTSGEIRVYAPHSHLRLTWQPHGWSRPSTIQVRVIPKGDRCILAFHQEHLPGPVEREQRRAHFAAALHEFAQILAEA